MPPRRALSVERRLGTTAEDERAGDSAVAVPMTAVHDSIPAAERRMRQLWLLALFSYVVALPLAEAPKNISAGLLLLFWIGWAAAARSAGGPWDRFDTAFALLLVIALLSALRARQFGGLADATRIVLVAWVVKRGPLDARQAVYALIVSCLATAVAVGIGGWQYFRGHHFYLQLPSVGHVNQSALFIALHATLCLGWAWARALRMIPTPAVVAGACLLGGALLVTGSRAALLGFAVFAAAYAVLSLALAARANWRPLLVAMLIALPGTAAFYIGAARYLPAGAPSASIQAKLGDHQSFVQRTEIWALGLEAWRAQPLLGVGPDGFSRLRVEDACRWRAERGEPCDAARYRASAHAHSLYVASLAERGVLGALALALLLILWAQALWRAARMHLRDPLWIAAAGALTVVAVGGLFNTTLRVEHGSAAALMLGLWLAARPRSGSQAVSYATLPVSGLTCVAPPPR